MRIAVVNDLRLAVEALRRVIASAPEHELAWVALDGREAVEKCKADRPDLVLMDLMMPVMDGAEATRRIMAECPCAVLVVTATVEGHAAKVFEAMGHGALDAVRTPSLGPSGSLEGGRELLDKIALMGRLMGKDSPRPAPARPSPPPMLPPLAAIGSSTGGPTALAAVLSALPRDFPAAVVVIQHVDSHFSKGLAQWLGTQTKLPVRIALAGDRPRAGEVLVAGSEDEEAGVMQHLILAEDMTLRYTPDPRDNPYCPSVDVFFRSAVRYPAPGGLGLLLTGMGRDGAEGLLALRRAGWRTLAQDQATSVVYGMPKAAAEIGAADLVLPLPRIGAILLQHFRQRQTPETSA